MSDSFDPDAWPSAGGSEGKGGSSARKDKSPYNDDPYDTFDFDDDPSTTGAGRSSDDFNFNFDDFGDQPAAAPRSTPLATSSRRNDDEPNGKSEDDDPYGDDPYADDSFSNSGKGGYDDGFDDDYGKNGYDDDDYQDELDQFDREPQAGGDRKRKLIGILAVVFLLGAVGIGVTTFLGSDGGGEATAPEQAQPPTEQQGEAPAAPAEGETLPAEVTEAASQGLAAWGRFAINGEITEVQPYFVQDGPQFTRFESEAADIRNRALAGPAMEMTMNEPTGTKVSEDWLVRGTVTVTRPGEEAQNFPWELRMTRQSERSPWQILTVRQF